MTSNDPVNPTITMDFEGEILVDVAVTPRSVSFGQVAKGEASAKKFTIKVSNPKVTVKEVKVADERFELKKLSGDLKTEAEYEIKFLGATALGRVSAQVEIVTEGPGAQPIMLPLRGTIASDVQYTRSLVFFKKGDGFPSRDVYFNSRAKHPLKVKSIDDPDKLLKISIEKAEAPRAKIHVEVADPAAKHDSGQRHTFTVHLEHPEEKTVQVAYTVGDQPKGRPGASMVRPSSASSLQKAKDGKIMKKIDLKRQPTK